MAELAQQIQEATARIIAAQAEKTAAEASAKNHEEAARADRARYWALKTEIEQLNTVLQHAGVQQQVNNASAAAQEAKAKAEQSQQEAEATLKRLSEKEAKLDELIQKASA